MPPFRDPAAAYADRMHEVTSAVEAARAELAALDVEAMAIGERMRDAALMAGTPSFWSRFGLGFFAGLSASFLAPFLFLALAACSGAAPVMLFNMFR